MRKISLLAVAALAMVGTASLAVAANPNDVLGLDKMYGPPDNVLMIDSGLGVDPMWLDNDILGAGPALADTIGYFGLMIVAYDTSWLDPLADDTSMLGRGLMSVPSGSESWTSVDNKVESISWTLVAGGGDVSGETPMDLLWLQEHAFLSGTGRGVAFGSV